MGWGSSACLEKTRFGGLTPLSVNTQQEGIGKMEPGSSKGIQCQEATGRKGDKKTLCRHKKNPVYSQGDHTLGKAAQGGCEAFVLGDIQNPSGHSPGHPAGG